MKQYKGVLNLHELVKQVDILIFKNDTLLNSIKTYLNRKLRKFTVDEVLCFELIRMSY